MIVRIVFLINFSKNFTKSMGIYQTRESIHISAYVFTFTTYINDSKMTLIAANQRWQTSELYSAK